jgi:MFS superfamily sulfate permease-like transporter
MVYKDSRLTEESMNKLIGHLLLLLFMIVLVIINVFNKNISGLVTGIISAIFWLILSISDITELRRSRHERDRAARL